MISVEDALAHILGLAAPLGTESVPLRRAAGRVLSAPVQARMTQPPFDASAMDGYAIREADHNVGQRLTVIGEAGAGHAFTGQVGPGQAARIFTGAPVPAGAERVILQEDTTREGDVITLGERLEQARHIRPRGQDFAEGQTFSAGRRLRAADLALLAAMNLPELSVFRRPVVAILQTGDELVVAGEEPAPDQIIASNGYALAALAEQAGAEVRLLPIAQDDEASLIQTFQLAEGADVILSVGGASVGDHDLVGKVAAGLGLTQSFWKIAMRPGKPLMAGRLGDAVMLGLPGNPVSAYVGARLFLVPLLDHLQGLKGRHATLRAVLGQDVAANGPRTHYMRATLTQKDGIPVITPFDAQDSALMSVLSQADALLIRPIGDGARKAGDMVEYLPL